MTNINIVSGDITRVKIDAIMTCVNSARAWFGGVDRAIYAIAGNMYHSKMCDTSLHDGQVIIARGACGDHKGGFNHVVFVIDDLNIPLRQIISNGLAAADSAGIKSVAIPAMRTGVMLGQVEKSLEEVGHEI